MAGTREDKATPNILSSLDEGLQLTVYSYLPLRDVPSLVRISRHHQAQVQEHFFWEDKFKIYFPLQYAEIKADDVIIRNWKNEFFTLYTKKYNHLLPRLRRLFIFAIERNSLALRKNNKLHLSTLRFEDGEGANLGSLILKLHDQALLDKIYKLAKEGHRILADRLFWALWANQKEEIIQPLLDACKYKHSSLHYLTGYLAALHGQLSTLKQLVVDFSINIAEIYFGKNLLSYAAQGGHLSSVEYLLSLITPESYASMLLPRGYRENINMLAPVCAAQGGHLNILERLLPLYMNSPDIINYQELEYRLVFACAKWAIQKNHPHVLKYMAETYPKLSCQMLASQSIFYQTPNMNAIFISQWLNTAVGCNKLSIVESLLKYNPPLNSALHLAAEKGRTSIIKCLLRAGANPHRHYAATVLRVPVKTMARFLRGVEFSPQLQDIVNASENNTALHRAAAGGHVAAVNLLLKSQVETRIRLGSEERLAIHQAAKSGSVEVLDVLLIKNPEFLNEPDNLGLTPLHIAAAEGRSEAVKYFLRKGGLFRVAAVNASDKLSHEVIQWTHLQQYIENLALQKNEYKMTLTFFRYTRHVGLPNAAKLAAATALREVIFQGKNISLLAPHHEALSKDKLKTIYQHLVAKESRAKVFLSNYILQRKVDTREYYISFGSCFKFGFSKEEKLQAAEMLLKKGKHTPALFKEYPAINTGKLKAVHQSFKIK